MPTPSYTTPTGVLGLTVTPQGSGLLQIGMLRTPDGDWAVLSGIDRLAQDVMLFLYRRIGTDPADPTYGNALIDMLGQPLADTAPAAAALLDSLKLFQARQKVDAAAGQLALDEMAGAFSITRIVLAAGVLTIDLTVVSMTGATAPVTATLPVAA